MKEKKRVRGAIYCTIIVFLAVIFLMFPLKDILLGTYGEHLQRKAITQGSIEIAFVYFVGMILILTVRKKLARCIFLLLISLLYMQNHQFLLPYLVAAIYLEVIMSIGTAARKVCNIAIENDYLDYLSSFVVGTTIWGVAAILFSICGKGSFTWLRIITACLFLISVLIYRRKPLSVHIAGNFKTKEKKEQLLVYFLFMIVLVQGAKSYNALDYDSQWYGLNSEHVLIGSNSFYDNLGMLTWVHYFPKFFELFAGPLSDLGEYSFIHGINIGLYELLILAVYRFLTEIKISNKKALFYTILVGSVPTIANMSTTAKPDIFTALFAVISAMCFYKAVQNNDYNNLSLAYTAIIVSACGKISSYPYIAILFLSGTLTFIFTQRRKGFENPLQKRNIPYLFIMTASVIVFAGTHFRTYLLTGYPLYPFTVNLWRKIGFSGVYPFADFFGGRKAGFADGTVLNLQFYIRHIINLLFTPSKISEYRAHHIGISWYSNFGIFFSLILLIDIVIKKIKHQKSIERQEFKVVTGILLPVWVGMILLAVFLFQFAQDGNYYIVPVSLGIVYLAYVFEQRRLEYKKLYYGVFCTFVILQCSIMFVSHTSWHLGTSAIGFNLLKSSFDSYDRNMDALENDGIEEFEKYIVWQSYINSRALGDGNEQVLFRLSTGIDCINNAIGMTKGIFDSEEMLLRYLDWANINFLIIPKENLNLTNNSEKYQIYVSVFRYFQELEDVFQLETEDYILLDITSYTDSLNKRKEGYVKAVSDDNLSEDESEDQDYRLNKTILFGAETDSEDSYKYEAKGLSKEETFSWTDGKEVEISLKMELPV